MSLEIIGKQIAQLRKEGGYKQEDIAKAVGVSTQAVSKWENGGVPDTELLPLIANFFGVSIDCLFNRSITDYKDLQNALAKKINTTPESERIKLIFNYCWDMQRSMMAYPVQGNIEEMEKQMSETSQTYSSIRFNNGFTQMGVANRSQYFLIVPDAQSADTAYFDGIDYVGLFKELSDKDVFNALIFLGKRSERAAFTSALLEKNIHVSAEKAEDIIAALLKYGFVHQTQIEMDDELKSVYTFHHSPSLVGFLIFARELIVQPNNFNYYSNNRSRAYLN